MDSTSTKRFYVYSLTLDEKMTQPFYIGKGSGSRVRQHGMNATKGELSPLYAVIRYLQRRDKTFHWAISHETDDESEAFWFEMKTITSYPYGRLCNQAGGRKVPVSIAPIRPVGDKAISGWATTIFYGVERDAVGLTSQDYDTLNRRIIQVYDDLALQYYAEASGYWLGCHWARDWARDQQKLMMINELNVATSVANAKIDSGNSAP